RLYNLATSLPQTSSLGSPQNILGGPLWLQAMEFAPSGYGSNSFESGTFLRFRELNVTFTLPRTWTRSIHASYISLTAAVRNLALWTRYSGDPEVGGTEGSSGGIFQSSSNSNVINNDLRVDQGNVPLMRSWTIRLNMGF